MVMEAKQVFGIVPPIAFFDNDNVKKLNQYCSGELLLFVHPSLYRALKLTFSLDIGSLSPDDSIMTEMGTGSMGESVSVLTLAMFNAREQP